MTALTSAPTARPRAGSLPSMRRAAPLVEIVVPVYNEAATLESSVRRLRDFLAQELPFAWRIVIADNASTDGSWRVARQLCAQLPGVHALHLDAKGRGRALRAAWSVSPADVLCYMDVDLSTDLRALLPLIAGLVSGHSDVAIGTRLAPGSRTVRSQKREVISRAYNRLLHVALRARFSDAQCGFKAIRSDIARQLLPQIRDEGWFFDTELLILAQRQGLRIHEVAVDWVEDPDSRVDILGTALADLRGTARLVMARQLTRFLLIGLVSTLAYACLYLSFRARLGGAPANALALAITAVANTQANRRYTFELRGRRHLVRQHAAGLLVYVLALALTEGALRVLQILAPRAPRMAEVAVLIAAGVAATATRYVALRTWVFVREQPAARLTLRASAER